MRRECEGKAVKVMWGLEIMVELNAAEFLSKVEAVKTITKMQKVNTYITNEVVGDFLKKIK